MTAGTFLAAALAGYLVGSISFARIVGRRVAPDDDLGKTEFELQDGSTLEYRGVSATSVASRGGPGPGMLVGFLDMAKGAAAVVAFRSLGPGTAADLVAGVAAVAGHNFPIWHRLRGGRGMSPLFGALFVVDWLSVPAVTVAGAAFGLVVLADPYLAYASAPLFLIPWMWWRFGPGPELWFALAANAFYWLATVPELRVWFAHRRSHPLPRRERIKDFRTGMAGMAGRDRATWGMRGRRGSVRRAPSPAPLDPPDAPSP